MTDGPESPADSNAGPRFLRAGTSQNAPSHEASARLRLAPGLDFQWGRRKPFLWWLHCVFFGCSQFQEMDQDEEISYFFFFFWLCFVSPLKSLHQKKKKKWRLLCLKRVISKVVWACVLKMVRQYLIFKLKYKTKYHLPNSRLGNPWEFAVARTLRLDSAIGDIWSLQLATSMLPCWYRLYRRARHFPRGLTSGRRGGGWTRDTDLFSSSLHFWQFLILVLQREVKLSLLFVVWSPPSVLGPHEQGTHGPKVSVALFGHPRRQVLLMKRY